MNSKFHPKPAYFETKNQVAPNRLIFNPNMSDALVRLLLALNGIATCTMNWIPIQSDLQKRLGWGKEKMQSTIKEGVRLGYLKVTQSREFSGKEKGRFTHNDFEFDLEGGYLKEEKTPQEKPADNQHEPRGDKPATAEPATVPQPLPCSNEEPCLKNDNDVKEVVAVSDDEVKKQSLRVIEFLDKNSKSLNHNVNVPIGTVVKLIKQYGIEYLTEQLNYMIRQQGQAFKDERSMKKNKTKSIDKPETYLRMACEFNWAKA